MKRLLFALLLLISQISQAQLIGPGRRIKPAGVFTETDPTVSSDVKAISTTNIGNWNTAFGWGNHAGLYLPIAGGTLTGTSGAGFIGLTNQSTSPSTPSTSIRLFSDNTNRLGWKGTDGFIRTLANVAITADRVYSFPDVTGEVILGSGTQTIGGSKSFTAQTSFGGSVVPSASATYNLGTSSLNWGVGYIQSVTSGANLILSNTSGNPTIFRSAGSSNEFARFTATNNNFVLQTLGAFGTDDNSALQLKTNKTASSGVARSMNVTSTLTAAANNDALVAIDVNPTFTNGAFTGISNFAIRANGNVSATKYFVSSLNTAPSSSTDTGTTGEIRITAGYIYVCSATNTWVRTALTTW